MNVMAYQSDSQRRAQVEIEGDVERRAPSFNAEGEGLGQHVAWVAEDPDFISTCSLCKDSSHFVEWSSEQSRTELTSINPSRHPNGKTQRPTPGTLMLTLVTFFSRAFILCRRPAQHDQTGPCAVLSALTQGALEK